MVWNTIQKSKQVKENNKKDKKNTINMKVVRLTLPQEKLAESAQLPAGQSQSWKSWTRLRKKD